MLVFTNCCTIEAISEFYIWEMFWFFIQHEMIVSNQKESYIKQNIKETGNMLYYYLITSFVTLISCCSRTY